MTIVRTPTPGCSDSLPGQGRAQIVEYREGVTLWLVTGFWSCVCALSIYLSCRMRPKGPWQQRYCLVYMTMIPSPTGIAVPVGLPFLLLPSAAEKRLRQKKQQWKEQEKGTFLRGARSSLFALAILPLLPLGGPPQSHHTPYSCTPQEVQHRLRCSFLPSSLAEGARGCFHLQAFLCPSTPFPSWGPMPCIWRRFDDMTVTHRCRTTSTRRYRSVDLVAEVGPDRRFWS